MLEFGRQSFLNRFFHADSAFQLGDFLSKFLSWLPTLLLEIFNFFVKNFSKCDPFFLSLIGSLASKLLFLTDEFLFVSTLDLEVILECLESEMSLFMVKL